MAVEMHHYGIFRSHHYLLLLIIIAIEGGTMPFSPSASRVAVCLISVGLTTAFGPSQLPRSSGAARTRPLHLYENSSSDLGGEPPLQKNLFASQKERREEDRRRKARLEEGFAIPGVSSAIPGAKDFAINVDKTEREYLQSLSTSEDDSIIDENNVDKYVAIWTDEGLAHLRMLRFHEAANSFNKVYQIKPDAYLWQDGLLKYYLEDYHGAAESLAKNAFRYESRFMEPASEERIWRDAAEVKIVRTLNGGRRMKNKQIPAAMKVPIEDGVDEEQSEMDNIASERRKVVRLARQLFFNSLRDNSAGVALARAQLQAMCGDSFPPSLKSSLPLIPKSEQQLSSSLNSQPDRKMYKLHSLFYLGLHYDALGQASESKQCMKMAVQMCANKISGNSQDITYLLPVIHMTIRDWYDDDDFDVVASDSTTNFENDESEKFQFNEGSIRIDNNEQRDRLQSMNVFDLKLELKKRNLKVSGPKKELIDRLMADLNKDALSP